MSQVAVLQDFELMKATFIRKKKKEKEILISCHPGLPGQQRGGKKTGNGKRDHKSRDLNMKIQYTLVYIQVGKIAY